MAANIERSKVVTSCGARTGIIVYHTAAVRKRVPELSRWLGALDWLGASAPTSAPHAISTL